MSTLGMGVVMVAPVVALGVLELIVRRQLAALRRKLER